MKVLMVADSVCGNGIGNVVYRLYNSLTSRGISCDIVCYQKIDEVSKKIYDDGNKLIVIPRVSQGIIKYIKNIKKICKNGNYDVIHIHTSLLIFLAAYAAKKENVPIRIGHAHGSKFLNYPELILKILEPVGRKMNRKYCTKFVTCSQESAIYNFGVNAEYIPNYVPTEQIMSIKESEIQKTRHLLAKNDEVIFGYMGALSPIKNVGFLPEIFAEFKKMNFKSKLVIIGNGTEKDSIEEKVKSLNSADNIIFLGHREDCNLLVQSFDYYISASKSEGMSLSMIEAQMAGKPCIVSSMIPDDSDMNIGLFHKIESFAPKTWANEIVELINNGMTPISKFDAYNKMKEKHLTEEDIVDKLIKIYLN